MKLIKYILGLSFMLVLAAGCKKEIFDDVSFVESGAVPSKLSMLFSITQDNTGKVTITPNGEGATAYEIFYGDATTTPGKVSPGNSISHIYREGVYTVKVVGHGISGKTAEATQQLTVSFRTPENFEVTSAVDPLNRFKLSVSAKADYETNFLVYYGDVANEVPFSFLEGQTATHTYTATGTYTLKVVAQSGGAATAVITRSIVISAQLNLPVTFELSGVDYSVTDFGGNISVAAADPVNASNNVKKTTKPGGAETWAGTTIGSNLGFASPIPVTATTTQMSIKVYSPAVGIRVRLKIEDHADDTRSVETDAISTVANAWETLIFDFNNQAPGTAALNLSYRYDKASVFFDFNTGGNGKVFYWDDVKFLPANVVIGIGLPLNFESSSLNYSFTDFGGGNATVINNPQSGGINTSAKVGRMIKNAPEVYGGSYITLSSPINFGTQRTFKMKVYSPRVGAKVLLKVENLTNNGISFEKEVSTTLANAWQELSFDYTGINTANSYQKVVLIFDLGTVGDGSPNFTFLFDDIILTN
jgi:hypothetical protein